MKNSAPCLLCCINDKGYYYQSYDKNHKMPEISVLVYNYSSQNKNNVMILFLKMIKGGGFFGIANFHLYIMGHTNNDGDRTFNILKLMYRKQNVFDF